MNYNSILLTIIVIILCGIAVLIFSGCAYKMPNSRVMFVTPFTDAEFETGGKIKSQLFPEVLIK